MSGSRSKSKLKMSIPNFNDDGLLPSGRHQCTLDEAKNRFAYNGARIVIWDSLYLALAEMSAASLSGILFLDGSYVTDKTIPGDIEVTLDVRGETLAQQGLALLFFHSHHARLKTQTSVDWYPTLPASNDFVSFFEYIGDKAAATKNLQAKDLKGILKITSWP